MRPLAIFLCYLKNQKCKGHQIDGELTILRVNTFTGLTFFLTVDWLPIVRELVAIGVNMMNLALSISLSLTVIAIGWIAYRPLMGIAILAMAATPFFMAKYRSRGAHGHRSYE